MTIYSIYSSVKHPNLKALLQEHLNKLEKIQPQTEVKLTSSIESIKPLTTDQPTTNEAPMQSEPLKPSVETKTTSTTNILPEKRKATIPTTGAYIPIEDFAWDQDGFNSPVITIYIDLPDVGKYKQNCEITFNKASFDLKATNINGKNYRLIKDNLEKDIIPEQCKMIVKANRIILKLQKIKGEYSYENWNNLTAKKPRDLTAEATKKKDPMVSMCILHVYSMFSMYEVYVSTECMRV